VSRTVVCGALLRAGTVLAARRSVPSLSGGPWEFPGGKVEPGEAPEDALARELSEELGIVVRVGEWLGAQPLPNGWELRIATVRLVGGEPVPTVHDELRWLGPDDLRGVDWASGDVPFLPQVEALLRQPRRRVVLFDQDDARAVRDTLVAQGWEADLVRERYQGEDDEEGHPWAVVTDAPEVLVETLVDDHDGWLDQPAEPPAALPPLDLPSAPKRVKRPDTH
jgi:mutator protein MutT